MSGVASDGDAAVRPKATLAVAGPSFIARTRTLRCLKNEQSRPDVAPGQALVGRFASPTSWEDRTPWSVPTPLAWPLEAPAKPERVSFDTSLSVIPEETTSTALGVAGS